MKEVRREKRIEREKERKRGRKWRDEEERENIKDKQK